MHKSSPEILYTNFVNKFVTQISLKINRMINFLDEKKNIRKKIDKYILSKMKRGRLLGEGGS